MKIQFTQVRELANMMSYLLTFTFYSKFVYQHDPTKKYDKGCA